MSCFFCNSFYHLSQNCDIYVSDESRKEFARSKECCELCLTRMHLGHHCPTPSRYVRKGTIFCGPSECQSKLRCLICYSKKHHSVYCRERSNAPTLFLPNIDFDLVKRFLQILDEFDQFLLRCRYPILSNLITLRLFKLTPYDKMQYYNDDPRSYVFIGDFKRIPNLSDRYLSFNRWLYKHICSKITANKSSIIDINDRIGPCETFLSFLTFNTKILKCFKCHLHPSLPIEDIFQRAPNIEIIEFSYTNIVLENEWPENLLKYKNGNKLKKLTATIFDFNFNEKSLANFMIEKCEKNVEIVLRFFVAAENFQNICESLSQKFLEYFDPFDSNNRQTPHLSILLTEKHQYFLKHFQCLNFTLKEFK